MTMQDTEKSILQDIADLKDSLLRSEFLIRCGKVFPGIPEDERNEEDLVKNCQTKTWVHLGEGDVPGHLNISSDSLSLLVRGALSMICEIFDGREYKTAAEYDCALMDDPDFAALFSLDEQKGLRSIIQKITDFCRQQQDQS